MIVTAEICVEPANRLGAGNAAARCFLRPAGKNESACCRSLAASDAAHHDSRVCRHKRDISTLDRPAEPVPGCVSVPRATSVIALCRSVVPPVYVFLGLADRIAFPLVRITWTLTRKFRGRGLEHPQLGNRCTLQL